MALTISVHEDCDILQLDVETAFLHASVQEQVSLITPPDYGSADVATGLPDLMKLKRSLYGLRRNLRNWLNGINDSLKGMGFTPTTGPCVYTFGTSDTSSMRTLYVDDLLLLGGNTPVLKELKRKLTERFTMTDMGYVSLFLGMQITRERQAGTLTTSQEYCTKPILARLGMCRRLLLLFLLLRLLRRQRR